MTQNEEDITLEEDNEENEASEETIAFCKAHCHKIGPDAICTRCGEYDDFEREIRHAHLNR